ncbi:enoyl-CoA hydratase/isomerase family protein [Jhaorihella thermophila]
MTDQGWLVRRDHGDGVIELQLNREPVNALSAAFLMDFAGEIGRLGQDDAVRAIVISSALKVYSAGLDLKEARTFDIPQQHAIVEGLNVGFLAEFSCPQAGGGRGGRRGHCRRAVFFVLAADFRVGNDRAQQGLAEVRVGATFPAGPMEIARATLDANLLRRMMLTGQPIDAGTAHRRGVLDELVEGDPLPRALEEARALAQLPPRTYAAVKRQIRGDTIALIERQMAGGANAPEGGWFNEETRDAMRRMIG